MRLERVHLRDDLLGAERVADAPACHRVGFADAVYYQHAVPDPGSGVEDIDMFCRRVGESLVYLVEDDPEVLFFRDLGDHLHRLFGIDGPRRVGGGVEDQPHRLRPDRREEVLSCGKEVCPYRIDDLFNAAGHVYLFDIADPRRSEEYHFVSLVY